MGYVGLNLETTSANATEYLSSRLEAATKSVQNTQLIYQLIEETRDAIQLSTTFYFDSGTSNVEGPSLNNRAQRDLTDWRISFNATSGTVSNFWCSVLRTLQEITALISHCLKSARSRCR